MSFFSEVMLMLVSEWRRGVLGVMLSLLAPVVLGQTVTDSSRTEPAFLAPADRSFRPDTLLPVVATELGQVLVAEYQRQAALLPWLPVGRYARTAVGYDREQGEFRRAQDPTRAQATGLQTEGLRDWNGWRLLGRFRFERQWQDSIRWSLAPHPAPARPYYLAAARPGNWDNQVYHLQATGVRRWGHDRLSTGFSLDFDGGDYARSNDPRPEVARHQLRLGTSVGYQLRPAWRLALGYSYVYGSEISTVKFGSELSKSGINTPFTIYDILGYGFLLEARFDVFRSKWHQQRGSLSLHHQQGPTRLLLTAETERGQEEFRKRVTTAATGLINDVTGTYDLNTTRLRVARFREATATRRSYQRLALDYTRGRDQNATYSLGNNYVYGRQYGRLEVGQQVRSARQALTEYGAGLTYLAERRADGSAAHRRQTRRAGLDLSGQQNRALGTSGWRGIVGVSAALDMDAGSTLSVPTQQRNRFSRAVVFPDYAYDLQHTLRGGLRLGVERPATRQVRLRLQADGSYLAPLTTRTDPAYAPDLAPHASRWTARVSFIVYH